MSNGFRSLSDIAGALVSHLQGLGVFKQVSSAGISSAVQLFELVDTLNKLPGAVVCLGDITHEAESLSRQIRLVVAVADAYKRSTVDKAAGVWPLVEAVEDSFIPDYSAGESSVEIGGVEWEIENIRPVESGDRLTMFIVIVTGTEALSILDDE